MNQSRLLFLPSFFNLVVFLTTFTNPTISVSNGGNETDYLALLSFKSMITQDPYGALNSWNSSVHYCNWNGVSCGKQHRRVTLLRLISTGLTGYLSPHIGNLSFLETLVLMNNSFHGTIPQELGRLSMLSFLNLDSNEFSGVIPTNLSGCSRLDTLLFSSNKLVGSIPKEIGFLNKLIYVVIHRNNLTGGIPSFLGNLTSMESFSARGNPFGGRIPDIFDRWKKLKELYIGVCNLNGTIPPSFNNLSSLTDLSLADNQLTGSLPSAIGEMIPNLVRIQLSSNQLNGPLPSWISNCSRLELIDMGENEFSGKFRVDFGKLRNIFQISFGGNLFGSGEADELKFIDSLQNCSRLGILDLGYCRFQETLPRSIGNLSNQLNYLDFTANRLYGNLPSSIGSLVGLTNLNLGNNRFTGPIPSTIGMLHNVGAVSMYDNLFSGFIPDAIGNLSFLIRLALSSNELEGRIPSTLGNCQNLSLLFLHDNKLDGEIPKQLLQLPSLSVILNLSQNSLSGSLPEEVGDLKTLSYLDLTHNNLSGDIPRSLGGCTSLLFLSLKGNSFRGMIPSSLSSLRGVALLDLSHNNLSGQIPRFLEQFSFIYLDLSYNDFEGEVPVRGVFANASAFSVLNNSRLCGGLAELGLPKCNETKKHKKSIPLFVIVILVIIIIASTIFTVLLLRIVYPWWKKKSNNQHSQLSMTERFLRVSYDQLHKATNGFSESNLIGKGGFSSVYKGMLEGDDEFVAVKVLHLQIRGALRSFIAEIEVLQSIRHRNLLRIITICSSVDFQGNDFKALVYEFMPNGSLDDWLHSSTSILRLNLLDRINILIDVASALDYLHNHCLTTIVHGDLKPSNILLDNDMVAHVGDFGLARFLGPDPNGPSHGLSTGLRGTIGYAAPEYGIGSEMTSSGDVYSFGILLLEVMIRKRPTDDMFNDGLSLHKFAYMALPDDVADVIDSDLANFHQEDGITKKSRVMNTKIVEECLASIVKVGVLCSLDSPSQRLDIKNVVHELQRIRDKLQDI